MRLNVNPHYDSMIENVCHAMGGVLPTDMVVTLMSNYLAGVSVAPRPVHPRPDPTSFELDDELDDLDGA